MNKNDDWFKDWFDTEYYHILYRHRDNNEAQYFIRNLIEELKPPHSSHILDLACGRGRHAKFLSEMGYEVTGLDLSEGNIEYARRFSSQGLRFELGDMRMPFGENRFDYIFNLFTSFGYFESREDNVKTLEKMKLALKPGGLLVLDFMNVNMVKPGLVKEEDVHASGIDFHIKRILRGDKVIKEITFDHEGESYSFEERVQLLDKDNFLELFSETGFRVVDIWGNFDLQKFEPEKSQRLILLAQPE